MERGVQGQGAEWGSCYTQLVKGCLAHLDRPLRKWGRDPEDDPGGQGNLDNGPRPCPGPEIPSAEPEGRSKGPKEGYGVHTLLFNRNKGLSFELRLLVLVWGPLGCPVVCLAASCHPSGHVPFPPRAAPSCGRLPQLAFQGPSVAPLPGTPVIGDPPHPVWNSSSFCLDPWSPPGSSEPPCPLPP